jgi:hypothetical protein
MALPNKKKQNDKKRHNDYARFAAYCLDLDATPTALDSPISSEMALEWLKLADAALHSRAAS